MMRFIINLAISVYLTSTIFMLACWINAVVVTFHETGKIFTMPLGQFIYFHFCPIVHTVKCFKIMKRAAELAMAVEQRRK